MNHLILLLMLISNLYPCAVCYGAPNHPVTQGMNNAILFLLFMPLLWDINNIGDGNGAYENVSHGHEEHHDHSHEGGHK